MSEIKAALQNNLWIILFILFWAIYIFYPFSMSDPGGISFDGVTYVHIAKNIVFDGTPGWQGMWAAPFFSVLMAALYPLVGNFAVTGALASKIMIVLLPLSVYLLASSVFSSRIGVMAAVLVSFHPHFTFISGSVEPEMTYTTVQVFAFWAIWRAFNPPQSPLKLRGEAKGGYFWAVLAGILASLVYQTRSEGLLIFIFAIGALTIISIMQRTLHPTYRVSRLIILSIIVASFILTSLPYVIFLKGTYGKWVLSPKSSYVQIWMKTRIYKDMGDVSYYPSMLSSLSMFTSTESADISLWGLTDKGKLKWQEPKGTGDLIRYLISDPEKSLNVYLNNFSQQIPGRIPNNSGQWLYPQVFPWYFVVPAFFWIAVAFIGKEHRIKTVFLLSPFLILFILPIFTKGWWKYLIPYSPFLVILSVAGVNNFCKRFNWSYLVPVFTVIVAVYSLWTVKGSPLVKHGDKSVVSRVSIAEEQKKAGEWAQKRFKGTPNYMVQWGKLAYFLNGRWTAMPVTDYNRMVWYARKHKADYLVFEIREPGEEEIVKSMGDTQDLEVADIYRSSDTNYGVVFLRLRK